MPRCRAERSRRIPPTARWSARERADPDAGDATFTIATEQCRRPVRHQWHQSRWRTARCSTTSAARRTAITVRVTDQGGLTFDKAFTIGVTDVAETPHWNASADSVPSGRLAAGGQRRLQRRRRPAILPGSIQRPATSTSGSCPTASGPAAPMSDRIRSAISGRHRRLQPRWYERFTLVQSDHKASRLWKIADGKWTASIDVGRHPAGYNSAGIGDFNGDGTSDVLWDNPNTNATDIWRLADGQWAGSVDRHSPARIPTRVVGDINHDGTSDVVWFNPNNGDVDIWKVANGKWAGSTNVGQHPAG